MINSTDNAGQLERLNIALHRLAVGDSETLLTEDQFDAFEQLTEQTKLSDILLEMAGRVQQVVDLNEGEAPADEQLRRKALIGIYLIAARATAEEGL